MRHKRAGCLAIGVLLLLPSCRTTRDPVPEGVSVRSVPAESGFAAVVEFVAAAPFSRARSVLLEFGRHAEFRPTMLESEILKQREDHTARIRFRMSGVLGVSPVVVCELKVAEREGHLTLFYEKAGSDFGIVAMSGVFTLTSLGADRTGYRQESHLAAFLLTESRFLNDLLLDAKAIRAEMERPCATDPTPVGSGTAPASNTCRTGTNRCCPWPHWSRAAARSKDGR